MCINDIICSLPMGDFINAERVERGTALRQDVAHCPRAPGHVQIPALACPASPALPYPAVPDTSLESIRADTSGSGF